MQKRLSRRLREVNCERAFATVDAHVGRAVLGALAINIEQKRRGVTHLIAYTLALNFEHLRSHVSQCLGAPRSGQHARKVKYLDMRKNSGGQSVLQEAEVTPRRYARAAGWRRIASCLL